MTRRRVAVTLAVVTASVGVALVVVLAAQLLFRDSRQDLTLAYVAEAATASDGYASEALNGLHESTAELCAGKSGCIEGYRSDQVQLVRFDSKEAAANFASSAADSHLSDWIVIIYTGGNVSAEGRTEVETFIDSMWKSE